MKVTMASRMLLLMVLAFSSSQGALNRVCYYSNWAQYRPSPMQFFPEDIDPSLCDNFIFSFAKLVGNNLAPWEWNDESEEWSKGMYERFNDMKVGNPHMKTSLAVGGWTHGTVEMTAMLATPENRHEFVMSSIDYLRERNFDGFDLDFEYPGSRGSPAEDKYRFTELVKELRVEFDREGLATGREPLLLSAGVAAGKSTIDAGYEIAKICQDFDFVNLMSYDLNGAWDPYTGMNSPLYPGSEEEGKNATLNQMFAVNYWVGQGCPREKMMVGLATYGRAFTLADTKNTCTRCAASGPAPAGTWTREPGFYSYYEACDLLKNPSTVRVFDVQHKNPYLYTPEGVWHGYDDEESIAGKVQYVIDNGFGGYMFWNLDLDDFNGQFCGKGNYPLLTTASETAGGVRPPPNTEAPKPVTTAKPDPEPIVTEAPPPKETEAPPPPPAETEAPPPPAKTEAPPPPPSDCGDASDGNHPHPETCRKYVLCNHGNAIIQDCAPGTLYRISIKNCDWPASMTDEELERCEGEY